LNGIRDGLWGSLISCATIVNRRHPCEMRKKGRLTTGLQDAILPHIRGE
jgi:hypothetical protein